MCQQSLLAHGGADSLGAGHGDGGGCPACPGGLFQVAALEIGPGQSRHKGIAAAGGADDVPLQRRELPLLAAVVGGKDAVGPQGDEYPVQPRLQQGVRRPAELTIYNLLFSHTG